MGPLSFSLCLVFPFKIRGCSLLLTAPSAAAGVWAKPPFGQNRSLTSCCSSTASLPSPLQYLTQQQTPPYYRPQQLLYPLPSPLTSSPTFTPSSVEQRTITSPNYPPAVARLCLSAGRTTGSGHSIYSSPLLRAAEFASPLLPVLHKLSCASTRQHHVFSHHERSLIVEL